MNRNILIVLVGGALIAVLVAVLVQASLGGGKSPETVSVAEVPKVEIIVAAKSIGVGDDLTDNNMMWQSWPKDAIFSGAIVREDDQAVEDVLSGRVRRDISEGEPLTKAVLVSEAKGNFLSASLDEGMRAVAINVKANSAVGGFVGPSDYVDVLLTYKASFSVDRNNEVLSELVERNLGRWATETILENVRVLAVDQEYEREEDGAKVAKTVTLEVDRKAAEVLALAQEMGTLSLSLRKMGDESVAEAAGPVTTDARLTNIMGELYDEMAVVKKDKGQDGDTVKIYNGDMIMKQSTAP